MKTPAIRPEKVKVNTIIFFTGLFLQNSADYFLHLQIKRPKILKICDHNFQHFKEGRLRVASFDQLITKIVGAKKHFLLSS